MKSQNDEIRDIKIEELIDYSIQLKFNYDIMKRAKNKNKENYLDLSFILNSISEGFILLDEEFKINFLNKAAKEIFQFNDVSIEKDLTYKNREEIKKYSKDIINIYDEYILKHEILKKKAIKIQVKDKVKYISISSTIVEEKDNSLQTSKTIITLNDVTEATINEMISEEQKFFIDEIVNNIDLPLCVYLFPSGEMKYINEKMKKAMRLNSGYINNIFKVQDQTMHETLMEVFKELDATRCPKNYDPIAVVDENNKTVYYRLKFIPYENRDGEIKYVYLYGIDVTKEIKHSLELEKVNFMKNEFFNLISHELRTPLTLIYSSIQLANEIYKTEITENLDKTLTRINKNTGRLLKLVNNILDISKLEAGYMVLNITNTEIVSNTEDIVESVIYHSNMKNVNVVFDTYEEEVYVHVDKEKYERIVLNLLSNAIKFSNDNKSIFVTMDFTENHFILSVKDQGVGIPKEKISTIFNRFYQVDNSLTRNAEGTGLGLSLVQKLVDLMDGEISVDSEEGVGTTFTVKLPRISKGDVQEELKEISDSALGKKAIIEFSDVIK
ncbi:sensor histidine kinase [Clostridium cellulovorans]|uniref:histidine kinase n=1 Tax=Clostridium cellulovorans (strain ATCC 35296 / DSM 3052 / OCM 3 / 743B) TaxID=573061 RepID=D9SPV0_CLOC7|nr:PAS domain-containing sensor histidine kinase [Clostridium cellulovorans]ADL52086.1 PAS/PAC sensor signal transduction histidine kinase [Clostridium cellulovorans 743B]